MNTKKELLRRKLLDSDYPKESELKQMAGSGPSQPDAIIHSITICLTFEPGGICWPETWKC